MCIFFTVCVTFFTAYTFHLIVYIFYLQCLYFICKAFILFDSVYILFDLHCLGDIADEMSYVHLFYCMCIFCILYVFFLQYICFICIMYILLNNVCLFQLEYVYVIWFVSHRLEDMDTIMLIIQSNWKIPIIMSRMLFL